MPASWLVRAERKGSALVRPILLNAALVLVLLFFLGDSLEPTCTVTRFETICEDPDPAPFIAVLVAGAARIGLAVFAHRYRRTRQVGFALGLGRGVANAAIAMAVVEAFLPNDVAEICTSTNVCLTRGIVFPIAGALVALVTFAANALRGEEKDEARKEGPVLEEQDETRNLNRDLIFPLVGLAALAVAAGLYFGPQDNRGLVLGGALGLLALRAGARLVFYWRKPATFYPVVVGLLRGAGWGVFGVLSLFEFVPDGPGMPLTAWQLGLFILCFSVLRQAKNLVKGPGLPILITLLAAMAAGAWGGYNAYRYLIGSLPLPLTGQLLWLLAIGYAAVCGRALLAFASEDEAAKGATWAEWLKANFWRNLVFVGMLAAYLVFRDNLAVIPFFPILEFMLGMAVMGFILTRVRGRIRATLTEQPTAAEWKRHAQRVEKVTEPEHDRVHEILGGFLTTGDKREEYAELLARAARAEGEAARAFRDPVMAFRETRRHGHLPYAAAVVAALVVAAGLAVAVFVTITARAGPDAEVVGIVPLGLLLGGVAVWLTQSVARRGESVVGLAASGLLGTGLVLAGIYGFLRNTVDQQIGPGAGVVESTPTPIVGAIGALALVGLAVPGIRAFLLARAIRRNTLVRKAEDRAAVARAGVRTHLRLVIAWLVTAFLITFPANVALTFLVDAGTLPAAFQEAYALVQAPILVVVGTLAAMSLVLLAGYAVARPRVAREDAANRARRQELHRGLLAKATGTAQPEPIPDSVNIPVLPAAAPAVGLTSILTLDKER